MSNQNLVSILRITVAVLFIALVSVITTSLVHANAKSSDAKKYTRINTELSEEEYVLFAEMLAEENHESTATTLPNLLKEEENSKSYIPVFDFGNPLPEKYMGKISSKQGLRSEIKLSSGGTVAGTFHDALDIPCPEGTPVYAVADGKLTEVWPSIGNGGAKYSGHPIYGGYIEIEHDDGFTIGCYAHLSLTSLTEGTYVKKGDLIGYSGGVAGKRGSGKSTGPHLHYSIKFNMNSFYNVGK